MFLRLRRLLVTLGISALLAEMCTATMLASSACSVSFHFMCCFESACADQAACMQAVREEVPGFQIDLQAHLFHHSSPDRQASRSTGGSDGARFPSPPQASAAAQRSGSRDENSTPNRYSSLENKAAHAEAAGRVDREASHAHAANGNDRDSGVSSGGVREMVMSDVERMKLTRERMDRLLASVNNTPRNCGPALVQLKSAVRAVPEEVWQVR